MIIGAFFDESGKFKDHSIVSLSAVAGMPMDVTPFAEQWERELYRAGLKVLTMKEALNEALPLSKKRPAKGLKNRIASLMPFVECIRKYLQLVVGAAVDVTAFNQLPGEARKSLGVNPHYLAFTRVLMEILEPVKKEDRLSVICDDDEQTAGQMLKLYRKVKIGSKEAHDRLVSISFANDEHFVPLQAADMVASLTRLDAKRDLLKEDNPYQELFEAFLKPSKDDKLWGFNTAIFGKEGLTGLARDFAEIKRKYGVDVDLLAIQ